AVRTRCSPRELRLSVLYFPFSEATPTSEKTVRSTFDISCCRLLKVTAGDQKTLVARDFGISRETLYQYLRED
ncbi:helix-turn-helix domain-containing protein, partial [Achromobacter sp.]|uniref:helix-turn-helix domain-containing protein n=1 Tax=Achromobacter sp. TaxID=134375 RepID=UPI002F936D8E